MIVKTGLLIVSNPKHIGKILSSIKTHVNNTLYIQLLSALHEPFGCYHPEKFTTWPKFSNTISRIYSQVSNCCEELDVRVLLSGLKYKNLVSINTRNPIEVIIFDREHEKADIDTFVKKKLFNVSKQYSVLTIDTGKYESEDIPNDANDRVYDHCVLGGTFDRLHNAHKLLLSEAALRSARKVTVGVTDDKMLEGKLLSELVEPLEKRMEVVKDFLCDVNPELEVNVVPISDPFGPTKDDDTMDLLVVSDETTKGGDKVNQVRKEKRLKPLDILSVKLIEEPHPQQNEESKISSSTSRMRVLGTLLKPAEPKVGSLPRLPYVIGLTGGIASGKSGVARHLENLGAKVINCDLLAHDLYKPGKPCHAKLVECFGKEILAETGEINRKVLGGIVFADKGELEKLNAILWPAIKSEVLNLIRTSDSKVVVVEAAVLLNADWTDCCDEIWTTLVPKDEAIKRLQDRNQLSASDAKLRLDSQMSNKEYVRASNVVFCTLWEVDYTRQQVEKAWGLMLKRMDCTKIRDKL